MCAVTAHENVQFGRWVAATCGLDPVPGPGQSLLLGISFAAWQSAVGTSLFVACGKYRAALSHQEAL